MPLHTGSAVLDPLRAALARGDRSTRLLVPTATMAQHIRNRMAREGFVPRPGFVETLSRFIEPWADLPQVADAHFYLIVERAVRRVNRPEFARVAQMPGFCASLARTLAEFSSAGCDARKLGRSLPATPLGEATLTMFAEVERELERRGVALRSGRLIAAAARIRESGMPGVTTVWLDGFHALPDPELAVIEAMALHADVTLTQPAEGVAQMRAQVETVEAATIEREVDLIAQRIIEEAAAGRPLREMGIIVRRAETYGPILRAVFERFGIPARFYLDTPLDEHGVTRFLAGIVDALLEGWEHAAAMGVLRMEPRLGNSSAMDQLDFEARKRMPGRGLARLKELTSDAGIVALISKLEALDSWKGTALAPEDWVTRFASLTALYRPPRPVDAATRTMALDWRSQAAALAAFVEAIGEAGEWFAGEGSISLGEFWRAAKAILRLSPLRIADERRNVVNVLSAHEARQWELPVVFVCGLVEKGFPHYSPQDPFFPDVARRALQGAGIRVRTTMDAEIEEQLLFDAAVACARARLVLTYPKFDDRGEENLPSLFLEGMGRREVVRNWQAKAPAPLSTPQFQTGIGAADLLAVVAEKHRTMRVTALESYVQCPFQFFARHTLDLEEPPRRPEARLDVRVQGNIVHAVLAEWTRAPQEIEPLFERVFEETCRRERIPDGYRTESLRARMRGDLARFARDPRRPSGPGTRVEEKFQFEVADGIVLRGRIDRLDLGPDGRAEVIDYKYSKQASDYAKNVNKLQGPLYLLAVEKGLGLSAGSVSYCGLRGAVQWVVAGDAAQRVAGAVETTRLAAAGIRAGNAVAQPVNLDPCRYCTYRDVCRFLGATGVAVEERI